MPKKRLYTYIVAGHSAKKVWYLSVPYSVLAVAGVMALVGLVAISAGTLSYGRMLLKVLDYEKRISENDKLRTENHNYKVQTAQLGEKIDFLETLSHKLEIFSGMRSPKAVGGVGGGTSDNQSSAGLFRSDRVARRLQQEGLLPGGQLSLAGQSDYRKRSLACGTAEYHAGQGLYYRGVGPEAGSV